MDARGAALQLSCPYAPQAPPRLSGTIDFTVDDVDALYAAVQGNAAIAWPLQDMPYGSREFGVRDGDGYLLAFQQASRST